MLFWILLIYTLVVTVVFTIVLFLSNDADDFVSTMCGGCVTLVIPLIVIGFTWSSHAEDLAKVRQSHLLIEVQEERIESLENRLNSFDFPSGSQLLSLNADTPVGSIVQALSQAEDKLAEVKSERAQASVNIEARGAGPMSGIVTLMGRE